MESVHMSISLPSLSRQKLPFSRQSSDRFHTQRSHDRQSRSLHVLGHRIGGQRGLVRARRGDSGNDDGVKFVSPNLEASEEEVAAGGKRRPFWQKTWEFGSRKLGFGGTWEQDPSGQRELEEFDLFLEGRGLDFQWKNVLEPSVENVLALVLTGLFLYAAVLIGWQLLLVAAAITLSALKYAVIASLILGVLIFFI